MSVAASIERLKEALFEKRPFLGKTLRAFGSVPLASYDQGLYDSSVDAPHERREEFIDAVVAETNIHFSPEICAQIRKRLTETYVVSTAEHQGPLTHPFFLHSNLLSAVLEKSPAVVLAFGNVSLNNSSCPRGLVFHDQSGAERTVSFFPSSERMHAVFGQRAFTRADLDRVSSTLQDEDRVCEVVNRIYGTDEVLSRADYSEQVVVTNARLWSSFFPDQAQRDPLVMLTLENIVLRLLKEHHLFSSTEMNRLLLSEEVHRFLEAWPSGVPGLLSPTHPSGTFLFWYLSKENGQRSRMRREGSRLVAEDGFSLLLQPDALQKAMEENVLLPGAFLSLMLLSRYYGVKCLGGFSQGTYLTRMHEVCAALFGDPQTEESHTTGIRSDFTLAFLRGSDGGMRRVTGIDLSLHTGEQTRSRLDSVVHCLTLEEVMAPLFPELYHILIPQAQRDPSIERLTESDLLQHYRIFEKIQPIIEISE